MEPQLQRPRTRVEAVKRGVQFLILGLVAGVGGLVATMISHNMAEQAVVQGRTGVAVTYRGLIVLGVVSAGYGLWTLITAPPPK